MKKLLQGFRLRVLLGFKLGSSGMKLLQGFGCSFKGWHEEGFACSYCKVR